MVSNLGLKRQSPTLPILSERQSPGGPSADWQCDVIHIICHRTIVAQLIGVASTVSEVRSSRKVHDYLIVLDSQDSLFFWYCANIFYLRIQV